MKPDKYKDVISDSLKFLAKEKWVEVKLEYIHNNPVDAGIVEKAEEYIYSSARDYYYGKQCGLMKIEWLL